MSKFRLTDEGKILFNGFCRTWLSRRSLSTVAEVDKWPVGADRPNRTRLRDLLVEISKYSIDHDFHREDLANLTSGDRIHETWDVTNQSEQPCQEIAFLIWLAKSEGFGKEFTNSFVAMNLEHKAILQKMSSLLATKKIVYCDVSLEPLTAEQAKPQYQLVEKLALKLPEPILELQQRPDLVGEILSKSQAGPVLVLGGPGTGKTSLTHLIRAANKDKHVIAYYFERMSTRTANPSSFVSTIIQQFSNLGYLPKEGALDPSLNWRDQFMQHLVEPLLELDRANPISAILIVDALDEAVKSADGEHSDSCIDPESLVKLLSLLPKGIQVICTGQPLGRFKQLTVQKVHLTTHHALHMNDLNQFVSAQIQKNSDSIPMSDWSREHLLDTLVANSEGSFLKVLFLTSDFLVHRDPSQLSGGFPEYYRSFVNQCNMASGSLPSVFGALVAYGEPIPETVLMDIVQWKTSNLHEFRKLMQILDPLVSYDGGFQIAYTSFQDWLTDESNHHKFTANPYILSHWIRRHLEQPETRKAICAACAIDGIWTGQVYALITESRLPLTSLLKLGFIQCLDKGSLPEERHYFTLDSVRNIIHEIECEESKTSPIVRSVSRAREKLGGILKGSFALISATESDVLKERNPDSDNYVDIESPIGSIADGSDEAVGAAVEKLKVGKLAEVLRFASIYLKNPADRRPLVLVIKGVGYWAKGDFKNAEIQAMHSCGIQSTDIPDEDFLNRNSRQAWNMALSLSSIANMRTLQGLSDFNGVPLEFLFEQSFKFGDLAVEEDHKNGSYWKAVSKMQAGSAYWYDMRRDFGIGNKSDRSTNTREDVEVHGSNLSYQKSLAVYEEALRLFELAGDKIFISMAMNSLGHLYRLAPGLTRMEESIAMYKQSLDIASQQRNRRGILGVCHGVSGWLAWLDRGQEFTELMKLVEEIYWLQGMVMIPPLRSEYDVLWSWYDVKPQFKGEPSFIAARGVSKKLSTAQKLAKTILDETLSVRSIRQFGLYDVADRDRV